MNNPKRLDGDKLLKDLKEDLELMSYRDVTTAIETGRYDLPSDQGESTRLREALEAVKQELGVWKNPGNALNVIESIVDEALSSSHTEAKNLHDWQSDHERAEFVCSKCQGTYWTIKGDWNSECPGITEER